MIQILELPAIIAGAFYGVLLARSQGMDFVGAFSLALMVAFGGGTLRDLLLDRHPIFWIEHTHYAVIVFAIALVTSVVRRLPSSLERWLNLPDALGLGLFTILGAGFALEKGTPIFVASMLGVVTGIFGGIFGDVVCNRIPSVFRPSSRLYATCSFLGCWVFLGLRELGVDESIAVPSGVVAVILMRLGALRWDWRLPGPAEGVV